MIKLRTLDKFVAVYDDALPAKICGELTARMGAGLEDPKRVMSSLQAALTDYVRRHRAMLVEIGSPQLRDPVSGQVVSVSMDTWDQLDSALDRKLASHLLPLLYTAEDFTLIRSDEGTDWEAGVHPVPGSDNTSRVLSLVAFLNDLDDGELEFHHQDIKLKPRAGSLVISPAGWTHIRRFLPSTGTRYVLQGWLRFQAADAIYGKEVVL